MYNKSYRKGRIYIMMYNVHKEKIEFVYWCTMYIENRLNLYNDVQCTQRKGRIYIMMYNVHREKVEFI